MTPRTRPHPRNDARLRDRACLPGISASGARVILAGLVILGMLGLLGLLGLLAACAIFPVPASTRADDARQTPEAAPAVTGTVRTPDGRPAAGVAVRLYALSAAAAGPAGSPAPSPAGAMPAEVRSEPDGRFAFPSAPAGTANLEAVQSEDFKVFRQAVAIGQGRGTDVGTLALERTGSITGKVTAPAAPGVTDFIGVDVYIPGSSYVGKTDRAGRFTLTGIAPGAFTLVASKAGLGTAVAAEVVVRPEAQTTAPELALSPTLPHVLAVEPPVAGPGAQVRIRGDNLGASSGAVLQVLFNGTLAAAGDRLDDRTLTATVPAGATSGNVTVTVGGVPSNGVPFKVLARLVVLPADPALLVGRTATLSVTGVDTASASVADPPVTWSSEGAAASVAGPVVSGRVPGTAQVVARSGEVAGAATVRIFEGLVVRTALEQAEVRLGLLADATAALQAVTELAGGATLSYASFRSSEPASVSVDAAGRLAVLDSAANGRVVVTATSKLDPDSSATASVRLSNFSTVATIAGAGSSAGSSGFADGQGAAARFFNPQGLAVDRAGNVFVADMFNHRIRKIDPAGYVTTLAGISTGGIQGGGYRDGTIGQALFSAPLCLAIEEAGDLLVTDGVNRVRRIGRDGTVSTVLAADGYAWTGLAAAPDGTIYLTDYVRVFVAPRGGAWRVLAGGSNGGWSDGIGTSALFEGARGLALDFAGNLYLADTRNARIRKVTPAGIARTHAGDGKPMHLDGPAAGAEFFEPFAVAAGPDGSLYVADQGDGRIRYITPAGTVGTLAGAGGKGVEDGPGLEAFFGQLTALALGPGGDLFVSDTQCHCIRKVSF